MADSQEDLNVAMIQSPQQPRKASLPRSERDKESKECPERSPVKVFQTKKDIIVEHTVKIRGDPKKSQTFQQSNNKRQASRSGFIDSFARDMKKLKTVTNDDITIHIKKWKGDLKKDSDPQITSFSTTKTDLLPSSTNRHTPTGSSPALAQPLLLAESSPSAGRGHRRVATARSLAVKKSSICKCCLHKYREEDDNSNPWTACMAWKKKKGSGVAQRCDVWVHTSCTGWIARNTEEVASMPDWYCSKHRCQFMAPRSSAGPKPKNSAGKSVGKSAGKSSGKSAGKSARKSAGKTKK